VQLQSLHSDGFFLLKNNLLNIFNQNYSNGEKLFMKIYGFNLGADEVVIEIGGGAGDLALDMLDKGFNIVGFVEPTLESFGVAKNKINARISLFNCSLNNINLINFCSKYKKITFVLQDVIEHIQFSELKEFFEQIRDLGCDFTIVGRTPNLTSIFGLRNSFGDNTHIHRFTDRSLSDFLGGIGFTSVDIRSEPYRVTGIVSALRMIPYHIVLGLLAISFVIVYGSFEGLMAPNLVFKASGVRKKEFSS
jgi:hypothetical protein